MSWRSAIILLGIALSIDFTLAQTRPRPGDSGGGGTAGCSNPSCASPPCAASTLGDVGCTTVAGVEVYDHELLQQGDTIAVGSHIFGPFEAGFTSMQDSIIENWGCSDPSVVYDTEGGRDIGIATMEVAKECNVEFPRLEGNTYYGVVGYCGGHTSDYHFHQSFSCLYEMTGSHSTAVGDIASHKMYELPALSTTEISYSTTGETTTTSSPPPSPPSPPPPESTTSFLTSSSPSPPPPESTTTPSSPPPSPPLPHLLLRSTTTPSSSTLSSLTSSSRINHHSFLTSTLSSLTSSSRINHHSFLTSSLSSSFLDCHGFDEDFKAEVATSAGVTSDKVEYTLTALASKRRHLSATGATADVVITFASEELATAFVEEQKASDASMFRESFITTYGAVTVDEESMTANGAKSPPPPTVETPSDSGAITFLGMSFSLVLCGMSMAF
ncbi:hypothetical protein CYMTET_21586 [Cymbomonas tetramitiformis]|uniref:Uncharacterized protein n=1 Tax=Cymbomonas tetramitiformis TaxID=36881 RepID=A0AAE0G1W5_9CHLO|nr:hypothetical protein CYMTET_21586 [Cymbomonas tetramitiformis]